MCSFRRDGRRMVQSQSLNSLAGRLPWPGVGSIGQGHLKREGGQPRKARCPDGQMRTVLLTRQRTQLLLAV